MASQAPAQASRRRSSPTEQTASSPAAESSAREQNTTETQSIPLNNPQRSAPSISATNTSKPTAEPAESRTCWICQQDDIDDRPEDSEWKNPCPCSLTAHESCLLEWIADQEAPKRGDLVPNSTIECPQCKAEYNIQRPRDPIVSLYGSIQSSAKRLILPTAMSGLVGCLYSGLLVYGLNSTITVFGTEQARSLLGGQIALGRINTYSARGRMAKLLHLLDPFFPTILRVKNYSLFLSMPLIGPSLVLLRTSLADQASGILLPIYFLSTQKSHPHFNLTWPPSPGLTFATLPFIKKAYNALYRHTFFDLEKKWDRAVQRRPREGETAEQIENQAAEDDGRAIFDVEWVHEEVDIPAAPAADVAAAAEANGGVRLENVNNNAPAPAARPLNRWALHQDVSAAYIATTVMGALAFPAISSAMGEIVNMLPLKWKDRIGGGLLREKWGRSVVGGCLFVVLKDMVTLYCKWRKARDFGKRKVMDYMGKKGVRK
ncbi:hypothetical protein ONS95_005171 [Cadophora gregata]|uniref:uncharacterized protein n=1 Tax=Cadophora gregata TaxID=51156 RepID=UPI0026DB24A7|nr:uncharacterized protein ONS95_005171 [Cadophora gregata]KAK0104907.1 hypothetical protein ONS95_005171 [Cadophora gregata]KAK0115012.1 hypothetical protein ONS96_013483 [Cadophora gregata f. sp. sojae]